MFNTFDFKDTASLLHKRESHLPQVEFLNPLGKVFYSETDFSDLRMRTD